MTNNDFTMKSNDQSNPFAWIVEGTELADVAEQGAGEFVKSYALGYINATNYSDISDEEIYTEWAEGDEFDEAVSFINGLIAKRGEALVKSIQDSVLEAVKNNADRPFVNSHGDLVIETMPSSNPNKSINGGDYFYYTEFRMVEGGVEEWETSSSEFLEDEFVKVYEGEYDIENLTRKAQEAFSKFSKDLLLDIGLTSTALGWFISHRTMQDAWDNCNRADWMLQILEATGDNYLLIANAVGAEDGSIKSILRKLEDDERLEYDIYQAIASPAYIRTKQMDVSRRYCDRIRYYVKNFPAGDLYRNAT